MAQPGGDANQYTLYHFNIQALDTPFIQRHTSGLLSADSKGYLDMYSPDIAIGQGSFTMQGIPFPTVLVTQQADNLILTCPCPTPKQKMCEHQAQTLYNIAYRDDIRIFFDPTLRRERLRPVALPYGLQDEPDLDHFFHIDYNAGKLTFRPAFPGLLPLTAESTAQLHTQLSPTIPSPFAGLPAARDNTTLIVVFREHKFYKHLQIILHEAPTTVAGKIKNPLQPVSSLDYIWRSEDLMAVKFFTGISRFDINHTTQKTVADIEALKAVLKDPLQLPFFYHDTRVSDNIIAAALRPLQIGMPIDDLRITVREQGHFYNITGQLFIDNESYDIPKLTIQFDYFILLADTLHLVIHFHFLKLIDFFRKHPQGILIHTSRFETFRQQVLSPLEDSVHIAYTYLRTLPASTTGNQTDGEADGPQKTEQLIYLSDLDNYVLLTPVMKYGQVEVPLFTKRQLYTQDANGHSFLLARDNAAEDRFTALLLRQHPDFPEQLDNDLPYFYLHRERFLDEDWFLNAFDAWHDNAITVLGFNQLKGNRQSPFKARIQVTVHSGIDWFNTVITITFGKQKVKIQQLHKAIRNKNRFIQLDDGTFGILPIQWLEQFAQYFNAGEIIDDSLLTPKTNFSAVAALYKEEQLAPEVQAELAALQLACYPDSPRSIPDNPGSPDNPGPTPGDPMSPSSDTPGVPVEVPATLHATLRPYQLEGLHWLNFLDDHNFGGCLADDMGLGKSIQIIAFILSQRTKPTTTHHTNLLVVPTSLIANWQHEIQQFAPSISILTLYGPARAKDTTNFGRHEVILTTYGTLGSDIGFLRRYKFNYIFLDESQGIKNPSSQRYETVRQLLSRNKIAISGTPIENNTTDLYAQLSFACPGLLGSRQYFRDVYAIPIDKFKDARRAAELQRKLRPFILRRTKQQVAAELPAKTEIVLHCPMDEAQKAVYDRYEMEFGQYIRSSNEYDLPKKAFHVLKGLTRLRQICNSPLLLNDEKLYGDSSSKIDTLIAQIESKSPQHKILVFSQFVSMLRLIQAALTARDIPFVSLTGATRDRASIVNAFQQDDQIRVFLISLKAGGTGLNLTRADYVYLVDPWWNPAVEDQAIDRSHRIGQENHVMAIRLICPDTIEEKIMQLQTTKKELVSGLIKTDTSFLRSLSKTDLLSLLNSP